MHIQTKRIKVIVMTREEHAKFLEAMDEAAKGHTSHYAERPLNDGSFLGVNVVEDDVQRHEEEFRKRPPVKHNLRDHDRF